MIISVINRKGGVGKTTTAAALSKALADMNNRVLVLDLDPQSNLTENLGYRWEELPMTIHDSLLQVIRGRKSDAVDAILHHSNGVDVMPGSEYLSEIEAMLVVKTSKNRLTVLKEVLDEVKDDYDYIVIDCPPNLGMLSIIALAASDRVLVPMQPNPLDQTGIRSLTKQVEELNEEINPDLRIGAIVFTRAKRIRIAQVIMDEVKATDLPVAETIIPEQVAASESPFFGIDVISHDPKSSAAKAYVNLAVEVSKW